MDNQSQLVLKLLNELDELGELLELLPAGKWLCVNPPLDGLVPALTAQHNDDVEVFTQDFMAAQFFQNASIACEFGLMPTASVSIDLAIIFVPKEKERLRWLLAAIAPIATTIWLVGPLKGGIKSAAKLAAEYGAVDKRLSARHCAAFELKPNAREAQKLDNLLQAFAKTFSVTSEAGELEVTSYPGVFNHGGLDAGTAFLLEHLPSLADKKVLDVGCGAGVIASVAAQQGAEVTAVDSNALAILATEKTLSNNALNAIVMHSNMLSELAMPTLPRDGFNIIVSNPPFHQGLDLDLQPVMRLIAEASRHLAPGGELWLVANRFLPYEKWFQGVFKQVEEVNQNRQFKIIRAKR